MMVECEGYVFDVDIVSERVPEFCSHCFTIGHYVSLRNKLHPKHKEDKSKPEKTKGEG
jgi:hypothetical protein